MTYLFGAVIRAFGYDPSYNHAESLRRDVS